MTFAIFSYLSRDLVTIVDQSSQKIGGKAYYSALALASLGAEITAFIRTDENSANLLAQFQHPNLTIFNFKTKQTPRYENFFEDYSLNKRIFKGIVDDFQFTPELLTEEMKSSLEKCSYIILSPASPWEMELSFLQYLKTNYSAKLCADLDFFLKHADAEGKIHPSNLDYVHSVLSFLDLAMVSREDLSLLGIKENQDLSSFTEKYNLELILTKGSEGAEIFTEGKRYLIPAVKPQRLVDATGAGDTFLGAYLFYRQNHDAESSGYFAAKVTSQKLGSKGAYLG